MFERVIKGAKQGTLVAVLTSTVMTGLIFLFGKQLMGIIAAGYIAMAVTQSLSGVMRGAGDTMTPMWISLVTTVFYLRGKWKKIAFSEPIMEK